jgi:hypothetical protein
MIRPVQGHFNISIGRELSEHGRMDCCAYHTSGIILLKMFIYHANEHFGTCILRLRESGLVTLFVLFYVRSASSLLFERLVCQTIPFMRPITMTLKSISNCLNSKRRHPKSWSLWLQSFPSHDQFTPTQRIRDVLLAH